MFTSTIAAGPEPKTKHVKDAYLIASLRHLWEHYYPRLTFLEERVVMPHSALNFIITLLLAFAAIKSQGQSDFPFITHPRVVRFSINSIVMYGLCCAAGLVTSGLDPNSLFFPYGCRTKEAFRLPILGFSDFSLCLVARIVDSNCTPSEAQGNKNLKDDITTTTMAITSTHTAESILLQNL
ncbi:hypothetical protein QVD17_28159 [Tagetes erecta]|uniref:Uncharacterized protein n=1 Tax=Tagetes erecta TaxID=13708 RepID=A0AAD8K9W7_TARER|nr:hypothetical protein QVD17_28159 [Tagetes erecta]